MAKRFLGIKGQPFYKRKACRMTDFGPGDDIVKQAALLEALRWHGLSPQKGETMTTSTSAKTTDADAANILRRIVDNAAGDDLERADHAFARTVNLDVEYGASGCTIREVWDGYRADRARWQTARDLLERVLRAAGL